jgi:hypothetical protein
LKKNLIFNPQPLRNYGLRVGDKMVGQEAAVYAAALSVPIRTMVQDDPQRVLAALDEIPYMQTRTQLSPKSAEEWAKTDPAAARKWTKTLPGKYVRDRANAYIEHIVTGKWPSGL